MSSSTFFLPNYPIRPQRSFHRLQVLERFRPLLTPRGLRRQLLCPFPQSIVSRFPNLRSVEIKGKPHFSDFNLVPEGWGGYFFPWVKSLAPAYPWLEEIRLKRMVISDEALELIGRSFSNFRVLVLTFCEGFSTDGLASIAANCSLAWSWTCGRVRWKI